MGVPNRGSSCARVLRVRGMPDDLHDPRREDRDEDLEDDEAERGEGDAVLAEALPEELERRPARERRLGAGCRQRLEHGPRGGGHRRRSVTRSCERRDPPGGQVTGRRARSLAHVDNVPRRTMSIDRARRRSPGLPLAALPVDTRILRSAERMEQALPRPRARDVSLVSSLVRPEDGWQDCARDPRRHGRYSGAAIRVEELQKRFGSKIALDGIDLVVPTGAVFELLGANGAGKTTTTRILATILRPDAGARRAAARRTRPASLQLERAAVRRATFCRSASGTPHSSQRPKPATTSLATLSATRTWIVSESGRVASSRRDPPRSAHEALRPHAAASSRTRPRSWTGSRARRGSSSEARRRPRRSRGRAA